MKGQFSAHSLIPQLHQLPCDMSHHSISRIATTLDNSTQAFNENARYFHTVVNQMQAFRHQQSHRDDGLNTLRPIRHILNDDNYPSQKLPDPRSSTFTCTPPISFHVIVEVHPMNNQMGGFSVVAQPKTPDGRDCMLESGQTLVMYPNFTVGWYIETYIFKERTVRYTAISNEAQAIRYLEVRHIGLPTSSLRAGRKRRRITEKYSGKFSY